MKISNWGNFPTAEGEVLEMKSGWQESWNDQSIIARGLGRSYGDASLGKNMLSTLKNSGIIDLNNDILKAKAGTNLKEILEILSLPNVSPNQLWP